MLQVFCVPGTALGSRVPQTCLLDINIWEELMTSLTGRNADLRKPCFPLPRPHTALTYAWMTAPFSSWVASHPHFYHVGFLLNRELESPLKTEPSKGSGCHSKLVLRIACGTSCSSLSQALCSHLLGFPPRSLCSSCTGLLAVPASCTVSCPPSESLHSP